MTEDLAGLGLTLFDGIDGLEPLSRLSAAVASLDSRSAEILTYHAAIERELDLAISRKIPHAERLHGLGFGHKIGVWAALNEKDDDHVQKLTVVLVRLNELRNAVAHGDDAKKLDAAVKRLYDAVPQIASTIVNLRHVAALIVGFLHPMSADDFAKLQKAVRQRTSLLVRR